VVEIVAIDKYPQQSRGAARLASFKADPSSGKNEVFLIWSGPQSGFAIPLFLILKKAGQCPIRYTADRLAASAEWLR
jgi:hypothetical protein